MTDRSCPEFDADLSAHLDGELPAARRAEVDRHLSTCRSCARSLKRLESVSTVLRRWDAEETRYAHSDAFRNRVVERLGDRGGAPSHAPGRVRTLERLVAAAALLGAAALGAVGASRFGDGTDPEVASRLDALSEELAELRARAARGPTTTVGGDSGGVVTSRGGLGEWEPIVHAETGLAEADTGLSSSGMEPVVWEPHGDLTIRQEHVTELERFDEERRQLVMEQRVHAFTQGGADVSGATSDAGAPITATARFLGESDVKVGAGEAYRDVQVWPVVIPVTKAGEGEAPLTARDAVRERALVVEESKREGMEQMLVLENRDHRRAVLVLSGDVFVGARQDRVAKSDVLVPPGATLSVPTMASGRRRSGPRYRRFSDAPGVAPLGLRGLLAERSDVGQIEFDLAVGKVISDLASQNKPNSIEKLYTSNQLSNQMSSYMKQFSDRLSGPDVVGFVVAIGSEVVGLEVFGDRATFEALHARSLRSYVLEALSRDRITGDPASDAAAREFLALARRGAGRADASSTSGSGTVAWIEEIGSTAIGYSLLDGDRVVHAVVFARGRDGAPGAGRTGRVGRGAPTAPDLDGGGGSFDPSSDPGGSAPSTGPDLDAGK